jgi:excinuclease ABC subunit A
MTMSSDEIILKGVRTHNLKNIDLILPHNRLYVITGVSGSGKSSLAFDTLYAEGQRRYVESLSSYARQFLERIEKPEADFITGISPALAIQSKNTINNARSTVGTQTEINDYLRVYFSRVGKIICPSCKVEVVKNNPHTVLESLKQKLDSKKIKLLFQVELIKKTKKNLEMALSELERQGFFDFSLDHEVIDSKTLLERDLKNDEKIYVLVDSFTVNEKNKKRILDSLELAFRLGKEKIFIEADGEITFYASDLSCSSCLRKFREPSPNLFSFNSPLGACETCQGYGRVITIDWNLVFPDVNRTIEGGAVEPWTKPSAEWEFKQLLSFCKKKKIPTDVPWKKIPTKDKSLIIEGVGNHDEYFGVKDFFAYLEKKIYKMHIRILLSKYRGYVPCEDCSGTRLKSDALAVKVADKDISQVLDMSIQSLFDFFEKIKIPTENYEKVEPVYFEMLNRIRFLKEVGLGYLSLSRMSRTLSGGEIQRIHLASSLGSALVSTLYVLDEPSIGLHERDNELLIRLLKELRDLGNTVVVVEHDLAMIEAADEVIDLGPNGGEKGGHILYQGPFKHIANSKESYTGQYVAGKLEISRTSFPKASQSSLKIIEASHHNLKNISVTIPFHQLVVITGVSGSGKSTLIYDTLYQHFLRHTGKPVQDLGTVKSIKGFEKIDDIVLVDQSPIGRTPRSNPATYIKAYEDIRNRFAATSDAKRKGFGPGHFSFNVEGGRCPVCSGDGMIKVEMHFLADVFMTCEACKGKRFKDEILEVRYEGKNLDEVLHLTVDDAVDFFREAPRLKAKLILLQDVGLGYLRLGQAATTLSGGEAQRMKLALEMLERRAHHILYLFDEPTTGLHFHDIHYLMGAFDKLLTRGHSLVIIEHNMEIIRLADYVIDLGPEGGGAGGEILFEGTPKELMQNSKSYTGKYLKEYLAKKKTRKKVTV